MIHFSIKNNIFPEKIASIDGYLISHIERENSTLRSDTFS